MFSDYIIYMDESGDHSLEKINPQYPIFVLSACIFAKADYSSIVVPKMLDFKFKYFCHDMVVLHSRDIRKAQSPFHILQNSALRSSFLLDINNLIIASPFVLVSAIIDKNKLVSQYAYPNNPYEIALTFCLERAYGQLKTYNQIGKKTYVIVEKRGNKEDNDLELVFRRIVQGSNQWGASFPFEIIFADKKANSTGMQIADLVSFPIGRNYINPAQSNQAYALVAQKLRVNPANGNFQGWGRKVFP